MFKMLVVGAIIVGIIFLVKAIKKKKREQEATATAPTNTHTAISSDTTAKSLNELRRLSDKSKDYNQKYQYKRKVCELGIKLFEEGKIVNDPSSEYDVSKLLSDMYNLINDSHTYTYYPEDPAFDLFCLKAGTTMSEALDPEAKGDVFNFLNYAWEHLADFYAEGKYCPRDAEAARKYYRMRLVYETKMNNISSGPIKGLMEVPLAGDGGYQEINKFISLMYGIDKLKKSKGEIARNCFAQTLRQASDLLFKLEWDKIGANDIQAMLNAYQKGVEENNAYAQYKLGEFLVNGKYVVKNEAQGVSLLEKSCAQGLYLACDCLSDYYAQLTFYTEGLTKQQEKEYSAAYNKWSNQCDVLLKKVEADYAKSCEEYLNTSKSAKTVSTNNRKATNTETSAQTTAKPEEKKLSYEEIVAGFSSEEVKEMSSVDYMDIRNIEDPDTRIPLTLIHAEKGDEIALYDAGELYAYGCDGIKPNFEKSSKYLAASAQKGCVNAYAVLAQVTMRDAYEEITKENIEKYGEDNCYQKFFPKFDKVIEYLAKSIYLGSRIGMDTLTGAIPLGWNQNDLGKALVEETTKVLLPLVEELKADDNGQSNYILGMLAMRGIAMPQDLSIAKAYFETSAAKGNFAAKKELNNPLFNFDDEDDE